MTLTAIEQERNIIREIFVDDGYRAGLVFQEDDIWLDVGCHHGWWSTMALAMGVTVAGGIDMDRQAVLRYNTLVGPDATAVQVEITGHTDLRTAYYDFANNGKQANAAKIDIQGAEKFLLMDKGGAYGLAQLFNKLLFEWHDANQLVAMLERLVQYYRVVWVQLTQDTMTEKPAYLVYAIRH